MTRYYYTCPLKAAYMVRYYGMRFDEPYDFMVMARMDQIAIHRAEYKEKHRKYFIHSNSLYLLEPQIGDLIIDTIGTPLFETETLHPDTGIIIQRNGQAFIMPEAEE